MCSYIWPVNTDLRPESVRQFAIVQFPMRCFSLSRLKIFKMRGCTWADYKGEPCGSRPPQLASSAWTAASAKRTSLIEEAAPPERIRKSHCSDAPRVRQRSWTKRRRPTCSRLKTAAEILWMRSRTFSGSGGPSNLKALSL